MDHALLAAFVVAVALISVAPGPDMLFIVANALTGGRRAGVVAALGMSTGLAVHTTAAAFGLGALIRAAPLVLDGVRIAGALFLIYLAITTWRASRRLDLSAPVAPRARSLPRVYGMAVLTNLANPKVILFYLAFFPQFLTTGAGSLPATVQFLVLGGLFIVVGLSVDASAGLLAGTMSDRLLRRQAFRRWLDRVSAAVFGALAVRLALDSTH
ncbi:LysE family translocator [Actinopolymorpha alba]|uniref:LysE family translocator n=1 Tax=Actinopolymorpha alba TaxID=533267 RepID=UPI00037B44E1|nr:LysE family translocator [Actinopolymorpha alba]